MKDWVFFHNLCSNCPVQYQIQFYFSETKETDKVDCRLFLLGRIYNLSFALVGHVYCFDRQRELISIRVIDFLTSYLIGSMENQEFYDYSWGQKRNKEKSLYVPRVAE